MIRNYRDLKVWQKSMDLVEVCYQITGQFPKKETYGLASQIQRSAVSIPANIAEGRQRRYKKEFIQYLSIAYASLAELETHIEIAKRLSYLDAKRANEIFNPTGHIGRMINGLREALKKADT